jgi:hypothetical protein
MISFGYFGLEVHLGGMTPMIVVLMQDFAGVPMEVY